MKKKIFLLLISFILCMGHPLSVMATPISDLQEQKKENEEKLSEVNEQIEELNEESKGITEEIEELDDQMVEVIASVSLLEDEIAVAGGVAANSRIRRDITATAEKLGASVYMPPLSLCGDNGAMIGSQAYYEYLAGNTADMSLNAYATKSILGEAL